LKKPCPHFEVKQEPISFQISKAKTTTMKDGYDDGILGYYTKFEPVSLNKEYIKYKDKHEKHAEVKMIAQIGGMLSKNFGADDVMIQGGTAKKKTN